MKYSSPLLRGLALAMVAGIMGLGARESQAAQPVADGPILEVVFGDVQRHDVSVVLRKGCDKDVSIVAAAAWIVTNKTTGVRSAVPIIGAPVMATGARHGDIRPTLAVTTRTMRPNTGLAGLGGVAEFTYTPTSPGVETLTFSADLPAAPGSSTRTERAQSLTFEIRPCAVSVDMIYNSTWDVGNGGTIHFTGIMDGVTVEVDESGQLHGEGVLAYTQTVTGMPSICFGSYSTLEMPATITGNANEDQLNLQFDFEGGQVTVEGGCPIAYVGQAIMESDPSPMFNLPQSFSFDGGLVTYVSPFNPPPGRVWVIVTPEEDEEAVSDAGTGILAALDR